MYHSLAEKIKLTGGTALRQLRRDYEYLMELKEENLLFSYYTEAGLNGKLAFVPKGLHGGWDAPLSHLRGTFTGHWLSAAAIIYQQIGDNRLKAKADYIVSEIGRCQKANGNGWAFSIPEKYLYGLKKGQPFFAPHYVCHKTMMGLLDMYLYAQNSQALEILKGCAEWFTLFTNNISRENMNNMMDMQETGGIMELWADLYSITGEQKHLELMRRYERPLLIEPLIKGIDVLNNMHANSTIPEIHGCARAYEITGEKRYRTAVEQYWNFAVEKRPSYATGGQTDGEVWAPRSRLSRRLSSRNQEHCVVYNMIRLADYLYRWSGEKKYLDYIEMNIENGLYAQGFWRAGETGSKFLPSEGIVCYYLPLSAGSKKNWGRKTEDFWCCHCTAVQANAKYRDWIYYMKEDISSNNVSMTPELVVAQYIPAKLQTLISGTHFCIEMTESDLGGDQLRIQDTSTGMDAHPDYLQMDVYIDTESEIEAILKFRIPWWVNGKMNIYMGQEELLYQEEHGYAVLRQVWSSNRLTILIPKTITCKILPDEPNTAAFLDGPVVLAGLVDRETAIYGNINTPELMLERCHEREWSTWMPDYRLIGQPYGINFKPLKNIGLETYTVYFPIIPKS